MSGTSLPAGAESAFRELLEVSRRYGGNPEYVLAGGGNTSWKNADLMYVKASGSSLAEASPEGFTAMDMTKLDRIWDATYPKDADLREAAVLDDMMEARLPGEGEKRPSVEALLHALFPFRFVVHTHPALVNGATCARGGEALVKRLFDNEALWVPIIEPGYVLAKRVKDQIDERLARGGSFPQVVFLQNHGVFVAADSVADIDLTYERIIASLRAEITMKPSPARDLPDGEVSAAIREALPDFTVVAFTTDDIDRLAASREAFEPLHLSFTPDHIVYYGYRPLYLESLDNLAKDIESFRRDDGGRAPRIIVLKGVGAFACHQEARRAELAKQLFLDDVKIAVYAQSFGGHNHLPTWFIDFIRTWEVEKYRSSVSK